MVRYGGRKVHTSGRIVKEIATWDGGDKSNWGPMFVQYLRVNSYGPLECHLIQISNRGRQIIFHPGLTFLASVFRTFLSYFSVPASLAWVLRRILSPYLIKKNCIDRETNPGPLAS